MRDTSGPGDRESMHPRAAAVPPLPDRLTQPPASLAGSTERHAPIGQRRNLSSTRWPYPDGPDPLPDRARLGRVPARNAPWRPWDAARETTPDRRFLFRTG